jgi:hypothetical protein
MITVLIYFRLASSFEIPIVPLHSVLTLQSTLVGFQKQIIQTQKSTTPPNIDPRTSLLPFCSIGGCIPEHPRNILSEMCHSIPELAQAASTKDGKDVLEQWFSGVPQFMEDIVGFWEQEYVAD